MDNRSLFIRSACQLFANRGYDAVGVQELVDNVGVTKPTLYHYFGSKEGLFSSILETYLVPFTNQLINACIYRGDIVASLENITRIYFDFAREESAFFRLWMTVRYTPPQSTTYQAIFPYLRNHHKIVSDFFINASQQHGNMRGRHNTYSISFLGMIFTYATMALQDELPIDEHLVFSAVHQYMYGIFS
jgi:TetR/AcrR family transcriptional regulator